MVAAWAPCSILPTTLFASGSAARFLRRTESGGRGRPRYHVCLPPLSILKPLKGTDPEMYESFRSHCLQDYPEYEIILRSQ